MTLCEELCERQTKSGQNVASVEHIVEAEYLRRFIVGIDDYLVLSRIDTPDEPCSGTEIPGHLGLNLFRPFRLGDDFHGKIRRAKIEISFFGARNAFCPKE